LGSGCQVTAPWTCLLPQWFDWSRRSIVAIRLHSSAQRKAMMSVMGMFRQLFPERSARATGRRVSRSAPTTCS
jgi:hypothetical protein